MSEQTVREVVTEVEKTNNRLIAAGIFTLTTLLLLAVLTLIYVVNVDRRLETQFQEHRNEAEGNIKQIQTENEESHRNLLEFVRCITLVDSERRDAVIIDKCIEDSFTTQSNTSQNKDNAHE